MSTGERQGLSGYDPGEPRWNKSSNYDRNIMGDITLIWMKSNDDQWCLLNELNLSESYFELMAGIYVIWRASGEGRTVLRVGQGYLRQRFHQHRWERDIMAYPHCEV